MGVLNNPRWEKFVQALIAGKTQRQAYREAYASSKKWKDKTVDKRASELFNRGEVLGRYKDLQSRSADAVIMSNKERKMELTAIVKEHKATYNDKMKAIDLLNKMDGTYVNNVKLTGSVNTNLRPLEKIDDAKLDEVAKRLSGDDGT